MRSLSVVSSGFVALLIVAGCSPVVRDFGTGGSAGGTGATGGAGATGGSGGTGGSEPQMTPAFVSGTRLRARLLDAGGGAISQEGWHDSQLNLDCNYRVTSDKKIRCVPETDGSIYFSDPNCSTRVATAGGCDGMTPGAYAAEYLPGPPTCDGLGTPVSIFKVGSLIGTGQTYYLDDQFICQPGGGGGGYYDIMPVDPTTFVGADLIKEPRGPRLEAQFLAGEDGSRQLVYAAFDDKTMQLCFPQGVGQVPQNGPAPGTFCLPNRVAYVEGNSFFVDPMCSAKAAVDYNPGNCADPTIAISFDHMPGSCMGPNITLLSLGPTVPPTSIYSAQGMCVPAQPSPQSHFFELGAPIEPGSQFAKLLEKQFGSGRLKIRYLETEGGLQITPPDPGGFFDSMRGEYCYVSSFSDGSKRCITSSVMNVYNGNQPLFSDAACTKQVVEVYEDPTCPQPAPKDVVFVDQVNCMSNVVQLNKVGLKYGGNLLYYSDPNQPGTCFQTMKQPDTSYYSLGGTQAYDIFAPVTSKVE